MQTPLQGAFRCVWMQNRVLLLMHIRELYGLQGDPTALARRVEYILEDDRFMCPSKGYEVCIRPSPVAQPGLPITTDYNLDAAYIIPVPRSSDFRRHLW